MITCQQAVRVFLVLGALAVAGCSAPAAQDTQPVTSPAPTVTSEVVALVQPTAVVVERVVTATSVPATPAPPTRQPTALSPAARLAQYASSGKCRWDATISLSGFAPDSRIMVTSDFSEIECASGTLYANVHWKEPYGARTDAVGRLIISYLHEGQGDYLYTFTDDQGNQASLSFTTLPEATPAPTRRAAVTAAAPASPTRPRTSTPATTRTPKPTATERAKPEAIVKSATLNLRSGPGQNYAVIGQVAQGDTLYPIGRWGACEWLVVAGIGRKDFPWVAGGAQYVSLNVPCEAIPLQKVAPPTETPRPPTGLLSKAPSNGRGELLIKNGTDKDGVVILVDMNDTPLQAAYIRAADSFRMTQIGEGSYRLYFSKGEAWDAASKRFTVNVSRQRFADTLRFGGNVAGYEVTLYGVAGGNAATQSVPDSAFPVVP